MNTAQHFTGPAPCEVTLFLNRTDQIRVRDLPREEYKRVFFARRHFLAFLDHRKGQKRYQVTVVRAEDGLYGAINTHVVFAPHKADACLQAIKSEQAKGFDVIEVHATEGEV